MATKLVLASGNPKKAREMTELLAPLDIEVVLQSEFGVPEAEEPHITFLENALAKARHASRHTGLPAIADDSGLCVASLGGAPGVQSARFAGEPRSDARNNELLLTRLKGVANRHAWFCSMVVLVRHADDPQPLVADGEWHGEILTAPRGEQGFGYDPLFYVAELGQTAAQMDAEVKNRLSHRGAAMQQLLQRLRARPL